MNVLGIQLDIDWEDKRANHAQAAGLIAAAKPSPETLVVLPELFATGFSMNTSRTLETATDSTLEFLTRTAQTHQIGILAGLATSGSDGRPQNTAVFVSPSGRVEGRYAKMQPFSLAREPQHYAAGDQVQVFTFGGFRIAPFICYDLRFPELFRRAVDLGADVLVVIANWPVVRVNHWRTLLQARAIENQAYVIGVNRTGRDPELEYNGQSLVIDPLGEILADPGAKEVLLRAEVEVARVTDWRRRFAALADRRPEFKAPVQIPGQA